MKKNTSHSVDEQQSVHSEVVSEKVVHINDRKLHLPVIEFLNHKSVRQIDEETLKVIEQTIQGDGHAFHHYIFCRNAIEYFYEENVMTEKRDIVVGIEPFYDYNSVSTINALAYLMHQVYEKYSEECVFIDMKYQLKVENDDTDKNKKISVVQYGMEVDTKRLANYLLLERYKDTYFISQANEENRKDTYYHFDIDTSRWGTIGQGGLRKTMQRDIKNLLTLLGFPSKGMINIASEVIQFVEMELERFDDTSDDMLEIFTKEHPSLVQFRDVVYNMDTHQVARMSQRFRLKHYHNYDLPLGPLKKEDLPKDSSFVDLPLSLEEVHQKASLLVERTQIIYRENQTDFVLSVIGNLFYHSASRFQVAFASVGGGGLGKSFFWNEIVAKKMMNGHISSLDQRVIDKSSNFLLSQLVGKELNLISELSDSYMSKDIIHLIKSVNSGDLTQVEFKNQNGYNTQLYAKSIMLANEGQLPPMRTSDVSDEGFKRRFVVVNCNSKQEDTSWLKKFDDDSLFEAMPHFALLSMMTFMKHHTNGNIAKFHYYNGCSQHHIEHFTTSDMVASTQRYFNSQDRFRMFFCWLPEAFQNARHENGNQGLSSDIEGFRYWLTNTPCTYFNNLFKEWHDREFSTRKGASTLAKALEEVYDIKRQSRKSHGTTKKVYGEPFQDLVESIILSDEPQNIEHLL